MFLSPFKLQRDADSLAPDTVASAVHVLKDVAGSVKRDGCLVFGYNLLFICRCVDVQSGGQCLLKAFVFLPFCASVIEPITQPCSIFHVCLYVRKQPRAIYSLCFSLSACV